MFKKLFITAAFAAATMLPSMASISISNSMFSYIGENGQFHRAQNNTGIQLTTTYRGMYSIEDISEYSFTVTIDGTAVPVTTSVNENGYTVNSVIDDSFDLSTTGTYTVIISGIDKIKLRRLSDNEIVTTSEVLSSHLEGRNFTYVVNRFESRPLSKSYPDLSKAPGECINIGGSYTLIITDVSNSGNDYRSYDHDKYEGVTRSGWVENASGDKICDATYSSYYNNFTITPEKIITEPGSYYLIYPTEGTMNYYDGNGSLSGKQHISHIKDGPYTIKESADASKIKVQAQFPSQSFFSDNLPEYFVATFINASKVQFKNEGVDNTTTLNIRYTDREGNAEEDYTEYTTDYLFEGNTTKATFPTAAYKGAGSYHIRWNLGTLNNAEGISTYNQPLDFSKLGTYAATYTFLDPTPTVENIKIYRQAVSDEEFQIDPEQPITVKLDHPLTSSGAKIYYRWSGEPTEQPDMKTLAETDDNDGFTLHSSDIQITSPGTLEYYTVHSNTRSEVKSITFVARPTSAIADVNADADAAVSNLTGALPGLYSLSGVRLSADPECPASTGIYVKVSTDGRASKVIIR